MDINRADIGAAREAIGRNREMIAGVKARLSRDVAGPNDFEVLRRAQEVASTFDLPVMIHMGQTLSPLAKLLPILKPGDIVTHMFAPTAEQHHRRCRAYRIGGDGSSPPRHPARSRQWAQRPFSVGYCRTCAAGRDGRRFELAHAPLPALFSLF